MQRFFFFNDTATTEIYTLSLHDALPISTNGRPSNGVRSSRSSTLSRTVRLYARACAGSSSGRAGRSRDRKSTRLNSSHSQISYAVLCLEKKTHSCLMTFAYLEKPVL